MKISQISPEMEITNPIIPMITNMFSSIPNASDRTDIVLSLLLGEQVIDLTCFLGPFVLPASGVDERVRRV